MADRRVALVLAIVLALPGMAWARDRGYPAAGLMAAQQGTTRFYDSAGRVTGRAERQGDTIRTYDRAGRATGRAEVRGNRIRAYDAAGRYAGEARRR